MASTDNECICGSASPSGGEEEGMALCPICGRPVLGPGGRNGSLLRAYSDSLIEAICEVMAEEGAIWSGAR